MRCRALFLVFPRVILWVLHYANKKVDENRIPEDGSSLSYFHKEVIPISASAGTLVVFHTDILHYGGRVKDGERAINCTLSF